MPPVASISFADRLGEALRRSLPHLAPEVRDRVAGILNPKSLAVITGVLIAWVASHAFGVGEAVDIILAVVGVFSIGVAVFAGLDELWDFANGVYRAKTEDDLEKAGRHFAKAVSILGIEAVLAVLFRGRPRTDTGPKVNIGTEPPRGPGLRARPTTRGDPNKRMGEGGTDAWGNITYSLRGSLKEQQLVLAHERIHQILAPKLYPLRSIRVQNRFNSYFRSSLMRYLEEALAEAAGQTKVGNGLAGVLDGLRFPVANGYVYLRTGGGYSANMAGKGVLREAGALIGVGTAAGVSFKVWFQQAPTSSVTQPRRAVAR